MGKVTSQIMSKDMIDSKNKANVDAGALSNRVGVVEAKEFNILNWKNLKVSISGGYDWSQALQQAISDVMNLGGGTIIFPPDNYYFNSPVYTHPTTVNASQINCPINLVGSTPLNNVLPSSTNRNVTRFIVNFNGTLLGVNYNASVECVIPSVYRNFGIKNIAFYGSGTLSTKYTTIYQTIDPKVAIQKRNASINIQDCIFWALDKGIAEPEIVLSNDNYCDQSTYKNLGFYGMGTGWIENYHGDTNIFENINGYDMAMTCQFGIFSKKGEAFKLDTILVAGKGMHLCPNFKLISLKEVASVQIKSLYTERVEGIPVYIDDCRNITIDGFSVRHYAKTLVKGIKGKSVKIKNVNMWVEEGKVLSATDDGSFSTYSTITLPLDFDFDGTSTDIRYEALSFRNGVHTGGVFSSGAVRYVPRLATGVAYQEGVRYRMAISYENSLWVAKMKGVTLDWATFFGSTTPTFDGALGELTFPQTGMFSNCTAQVSMKRSATKVNQPCIISDSPLIVRLYDYTNATIGTRITVPGDVAFNLDIIT
jgi:hypothetical protein